MNTLNYFLTANGFLLLFYGCYHVLIRRNTFFGTNRMYLLASLGLSMLLPLITLPAAWVVTPTTGMQIITLPAFTVGVPSAPVASEPTPMFWLWLIYGIGVAVMLVRLGLNLRAVFQLINTGTAERRAGYTLVRLPEVDHLIPSFSFGPYLVLNATDAQTEPDALMHHEEAHIRQHHTADVLFVELVRAVFWYNPVLWLYKLAVQEVHEFLADRTASDAVAPIEIDYPRQLVAYALCVAPTALVTPFVSMSTLKQRIVMLKKPQSNRRALLKYALVLPVAGLLTLCTQPDRDQPKTEVAERVERANARKPVSIDGPIFTVVEQQPEFPGGMAELGQYLAQSIKYPAAAQRANVSGRVFLSFIVTKNGEITDVNILKGIGFGADEEAIRVTAQMPRWIPGKQNGRAVNVKYNLPINFSLDDEKGDGSDSPNKLLNTDKFEHVYIDGKEIKSKAEMKEIAEAGNFRKIDIDREHKTISITTK